MTKIIRTKMRAEGGITAVERSAMEEHAKLWIKRVLRTDPIEPDKIIPAIEALYAAANLKKPRVVIVPSPMVMAFAYGAASAIWYIRKKQKTTATRAATRAATATATATAAAAACNDLAGQLGISCAKQWFNNYHGGNMWSSYDCYLTAARDILGLKFPSHTKYVSWEEAAIHGGLRVMHEEFCMVSDFPEVLKMDAENRPHCSDGPSHRWRDGWSLYHWHGTRIPDEWIEIPEFLTPQVALSCTNLEQRRAACEILGWSRVLKELGAKTIDRDNDPEIGELVQVSLPGLPIPARFLRVQCGTGREFAIGIPPHINKALDAQAWMVGLEPKDFACPKVRT